jgi:hypothetical protein
MNLIWDSLAREFVAEFSPDFHGDLEAVKAAGFHTNGPPSWRWYAPAPGVKALNRLRQNKPASGLTISPEALAIYQPLAEAEAQNEAVRKSLAEHKKAAKKTAKKERQASASNWLPAGKEYLGAEDLPPLSAFEFPCLAKTQPIGTCQICRDPIYGWPDFVGICLYCEKQAEDEFLK